MFGAHLVFLPTGYDCAWRRLGRDGNRFDSDNLHDRRKENAPTPEIRAERAVGAGHADLRAAPERNDGAAGCGDVWNIRIKGASNLLGNEEANEKLMIQHGIALSIAASLTVCLLDYLKESITLFCSKSPFCPPDNITLAVQHKQPDCLLVWDTQGLSEHFQIDV